MGRAMRRSIATARSRLVTYVNTAASLYGRNYDATFGGKPIVPDLGSDGVARERSE